MPTKRPFLSRIYSIQQLTTKSDPRLLVNMVNNLQKTLKGPIKSSAPIARVTRDFFANILRRKED